MESDEGVESMYLFRSCEAVSYLASLYNSPINALCASAKKSLYVEDWNVVQTTDRLDLLVG